MLAEVAQERLCVICGKVIPSSYNRNRLTCSTMCRVERNAQANRKYYPERPEGLTHGTRGAISEMVACADLMTRGYHVFRAQSPACPCDLIIMKDDRCLRVEVTTGFYTQGGNLGHPKYSKEVRWDLLAIVVAGGVQYQNPEFQPTTP